VKVDATAEETVDGTAGTILVDKIVLMQIPKSD
jgi:hypothetical protein